MENTPKLQPFPTELLRVQSGLFHNQYDCWELQLKLCIFDLPNRFQEKDAAEYYTNIETDYRIDFVEVDPRELQGIKKTFQTPNNAIDGSIYIDTAHHPADITLFDASQISFDTPGECTLHVEIYIDFTFEGLWYDENIEYDACTVSYSLHLTPAENGWAIGPSDPL